LSIDVPGIKGGRNGAVDAHMEAENFFIAAP
jgi:hypothetical protein